MRVLFVITLPLLVLLNVQSVNSEQLDLIDVFQLAQENDQRYLQEQSRRNSTRELKSQAIAAILPTISATGRSEWNYLRNKKVGFQGEGLQRFWNHTGQVDINQPIFNWDSWILLDQSEYEIAKAEALYAKVYQDLILRIVNAYVDVLLAEETLALAKAELKARHQVLQQAKLRFEVGMAPVTDSLEAEARFAATSADNAVAEAAIVDAQSGLQEIIGIPIISGNLAALIADMPLEPPEPAELEEWKNYAFNRNRELVAAMSDVNIAKQQIEHQKAGHYPTVSGVASYSFNDNNSSFGLRGETGSIGVQVDVPIFAGGGVSSRVRQAHHDYEANKHAFELTKRSIQSSVTKAFYDVKAKINQVTALRKSVQSFDKALEATQAGMEVGSNTLADVLDAQTDLYTAKRDLSQQLYAYLVSWLDLRLAAGLLEQGDVVRLNKYLLIATE
ncbi:MAG: TolC family outer membrane protein [Methylococcales bacterium]